MRKPEDFTCIQSVAQPDKENEELKGRNEILSQELKEWNINYKNLKEEKRKLL